MVTANTIPKVQAALVESLMFRHHMGQISRQSTVFFAGTMFTTVAAYFFKVYLARVLGAEALGIYALGMTIVGVLGIFNALGLPQSAVRFVALYSATGKLDQLRSFLWRGTGMLLVSNVLLSAVILLVGPWIAVRFYHTPTLSRYIGLFALMMLLGALTTFFGQVLAGYKDVTRRTIITNFIGSPLTMLLTVVLVLEGAGLRGYIVAQVASALVVFLFLLAIVWKLTPGDAGLFPDSRLPSLDPQVLSFSAAMLGMGILEFLLTQSDKVLIGFYLSARDVGIYAMAAALVGFVPIALQSVNQIFSPIIADLYARGEREVLGRLFQTLTKWIFGLTLPLATVVIIFARPIMSIFRYDFESGGPILVIGALGQLVNCGVGSVGYLLLMSGNQRRLIKVQVTMAGVMVLLNLLLIPAWGIVGAAVAAATVNIGTNGWNLREVRRSLGFSPYNRSYIQLVPPLLALLIATLALKVGLAYVRPQWAVIILAIAVAYLIFLGVMFSFGLSADDELIVNAIWSRIRAFHRAAVATT